MQIPKLRHFRSIAAERMKAEIGIQECYFGKFIISGLKSDVIVPFVDKTVTIFHNRTHDTVL